MMNITRNPAALLLAIYLILIALIQILGIHLGVLSFIVPVLALAAGVMILLGRLGK